MDRIIHERQHNFEIYPLRPTKQPFVENGIAPGLSIHTQQYVLPPKICSKYFSKLLRCRFSSFSYTPRHVLFSFFFAQPAVVYPLESGANAYLSLEERAR